MEFKGPNDEYFEVVEINQSNCKILKNSTQTQLSILWFTGGNSMTIDSVPYTFLKDQIVTFTEFHELDNFEINGLMLLRWNKPFYCILDHDSEVGCKGLLFYGANSLPILTPDKQEAKMLSTVWELLILEMKMRDSLQLEMLQMMLKRILILCTRIFKRGESFNVDQPEEVELIRQFNYLVEQNFRDKHSVSEYAKLLYKSPKTLTNLFKKLDRKTPLQYIHQRIMLEAHRLLKYTEKTVSEIAYELGYLDVQSFSRFFKRNEGVSPLEFKMS